MELLPRAITERLQMALRRFPVVGIVGPRQVGKTTLVREQLFVGRADVRFLDLENPRDRRLLDEPYDYLESLSGLTVVIDEVQLMPELFALLRPLVDADRRPGRFVLLGSASPRLMRDASESLAGRIQYTELAPISRVELGARTDDVRTDDARTDDGRTGGERHWLRGGYPDALLAADASASYDWREAYLRTYVTRELPALGSVGQPETLRRLLRMLAAQQGDLFNQSAYARSLGISQPSVRSYVDLLTQSFLVAQLPPYHANVRKRLVKTPKVYVRDAGLLHVLNRIEDAGQLRDSLIVGASWEGYVVEQVRAVVSNRAELFFYRTAAGAEIDLVIVGRRGRVACVEVKFSSAPALTRGFYNAREDVAPERTYVVGLTAERYSRAGGVAVLGLDEALAELTGW